MKKLYKRLLAIVVAMVLLVSNVIIISQAASNYWESVKGVATLDDINNGDFCKFSVNSSCSASTKQAYNMLDEYIVLKNVKIPNNYWGFIGFSVQKPTTWFYSDIDNGRMGFLIYPISTGGYRVRLLVPGAEITVAEIPTEEIYTLSFAKINEQYNMIINGVVYKNTQMSNFIKKYGESVYINLSASNYFNGAVKIGDIGWEYPKGLTNIPKLYCDVSGSVNATLESDAIVNTTQKIDWNTELLSVEGAEFLDEEQVVSIVLNKSGKELEHSSSAENGDVIHLRLINKSEDSISVNIYDGTLKELGVISKAPEYNFSFICKNDTYCLQINDTIFTEEIFNSFMTLNATNNTQAGKSFVAISSENLFAVKLGVWKSSWQQNASDKEAKITITDDGYSAISLNSIQAAVSPKAYDILTNEITIRNISNISGSYVAYVDLVKTLNKRGPSVANDQILTLVFQKNNENIDLFVISSTGAWCKIDSFAITDECKIKIVNYNNSYYFAINGKICKNINNIAYNNLQTFIGKGSACISYIGFNCNNTAKAEFKVKKYVPELPIFEGFKVFSGTGTYDAIGNEETGYTVTDNNAVYAFSNPSYDVTQKSLSAKISGVNGYLWFAVSLDCESGNYLQTGNANDINKVVFIITPKEENTKAQISYWNADGSGDEKVITTIPFDWSVNHTYDVRQGDDEQWYIAIDNKLIYGVTSKVLTSFMNNNVKKYLHFAIGGNSGFSVEELKVLDQIPGDTSTDSTGWKYFASSVTGDLPGDEAKGYSVVSPSGNFFGFTVKRWDVTKKAVSLDFEKVGDWFGFYLSATGASDSNVFPTGAGKDVNRFAFIITPKVNNTRAQISYWNANGNGGEGVIELKAFDWDGVHTFDVRKGSDGHWYICVDNELITGITSQVLDEFMEIHSNEKLRFGIGGFNGAFEVKNLKIVDQGEADTKVNTEGWRYFSSSGNGNMVGNDDEGYSTSLETGDLYALSRQKYDMNTTAISFKIEDVRNWIWFSVSTKDTSDVNPLPSGDASEISRYVFIITPKFSATHAQFSFWDTESRRETVIVTRQFDWYSEHTLDVRYNADEGHWFLCVDGIVLMKGHSEVFDEFMSIHKDEELHYGIGGSGCFGVSNLKIVEKPKSKENILDDSDETIDNSGNVDIDYEFEFSSDNIDSDSDFYNDGMFDENTNDFEGEIDGIDIDEQKDPHEGMVQARIKKRRLVQKGHGIIFNTFEKIAMIFGAVVFVGGIISAIILIVRKVKSKRLKI